MDSRLLPDGPIEWDFGQSMPAAVLELVADLQGNILRPHGREAALHLALTFTEAAPAREWLAGLPVSTCAGELGRSSQGRGCPRPADDATEGAFLQVALSAAGYSALGLEAERPGDGAFRAGMRSRQAVLGDPDATTWEEPWGDAVHAMLIVADDTIEAAQSELQRQLGDVAVAGVDVRGIEVGRLIRNDLGETIEHFGYVDGRSQPRFFSGDVARDLRRNRIAEWDPGFPPGQVVVCDSSGPGSYFVFRKLEQDVQGFKRREGRLAAALHLHGDDAERAGGIVVGRMEDGRPVDLLHRLPTPIPVENGFDYRAAGASARACPTNAHVRLVNERGADPSSRRRIMARRGIPYGDRLKHPNAEHEPSEFPTGGVGLLFMAFMADIAQQFEATQIAANGTADRHDALIGQSAHGRQIWRDPATGNAACFDFGHHVTLMGGEYFFAPSLSFLRGLPRR